MRTSPILTGILTTVLAFLIVWALAAGFDVNLITAMSRAMPLILISGLITAFATAVARHELA